MAFGDVGNGRVVREVADGVVSRSFTAGALDSVWQVVADDSLVAGAVSGLPQEDRPTDRSGIVVLERDGYAARAYLPIAGTTYQPGIGAGGFGVGDVSPVAWLDDRTLLLVHAPALGEPWSLVAWDVDSGELSLVSTGGDGLRLVGVARDLVED